MRGRRRVLAALAAAGCTEVGTDPARAVAIQFDALPYPSVVAGDTLRDEAGTAAPLAAVAYDSRGAVIAGARFTWVSLDTGLTVTASGLVIASRGRTGEPRVVAEVTGLQSLPLPVPVGRAPASLAATSRGRDTLAYALPDVAGTNQTPPSTVRLVPRDSSGGITGARGILVRYRLFWRGVVVAPTDTIVQLVDDTGRPSTVDTTGADGAAGRRVRVRANALPSSVDSVIVEASARYLGSELPGSPARFTYLIRPRGFP